MMSRSYHMYRHTTRQLQAPCAWRVCAPRFAIPSFCADSGVDDIDGYALLPESADQRMIELPRSSDDA